MVKKLKALSEKKTAGAAGLLEGQLASSVKESAQQIWLAGMGAFAKAQAGGEKVFETLVREGVSLQRKTHAAAEDKITEVANRMTGMAGGLSGKANQHWDKLESIFEERVAKALNRLGVPSAKDVEALMAREQAKRVTMLDPNIRPGFIPDKQKHLCRRQAEAVGASARMGGHRLRPPVDLWQGLYLIRRR